MTRSTPILFLALTTAALAQTLPTTAPSTPDLSSPRTALAALFDAMRTGDLAAAKSCLLFRDAQQAEAFDLNAAQVTGPLKLLHALEARFGDAGRKTLANAGLEKSLEKLLDRAKQIDFKIDGNTAVATDPKAAVNPSAETELTGITLQKHGDQWKVVAATFSDYATDLPSAQLPMMRKLRDAILAAADATTARLANGDFKTPDEAYADYQSRLKSAADQAATR